MAAALLGSLKGKREEGKGTAVSPRCAPPRPVKGTGSTLPTLTSWQRWPIPRILKEPVGWTFSSFM